MLVITASWAVQARRRSGLMPGPRGSPRREGPHEGPLVSQGVDEWLPVAGELPQAETGPVEDLEPVARQAEDLGAQLVHLARPRPLFASVADDRRADEQEVDVAVGIAVPAGGGTVEDTRHGLRIPSGEGLLQSP